MIIRSTITMMALTAALLCLGSTGRAAVIIDNWPGDAGISDNDVPPQTQVFTDPDTGMSGTLRVGTRSDGDNTALTAFQAHSNGDELGGDSAGDGGIQNLNNGEAITFEFIDAMMAPIELIFLNWNDKDAAIISVPGKPDIVRDGGAGDSPIVDLASFGNLGPGVAITVRDYQDSVDPGEGNGWTIDDFSFSIAVPEPASLTLLGLGGLVMLKRRR